MKPIIHKINTTTATFGNKNIGFGSGEFNNKASVSIFALKEPVGGRSITSDDIDMDGNTIELIFNNPESMNVLIKWLIETKERFEENYKT